MPPGLPCPNPTCSHIFPPDAVKAGTLRCPRCGHTFDFRGGAAPPRPAAPANRPTPVPPTRPKPAPRPVPAPPSAAPPAPPVAIPVAAVVPPGDPTNVPLAMPVGAAPPSSPELVFTSHPELTIAPRKPAARRRPWRTAIVIILSLAGTGGIVYGVYVLVTMIAGGFGNPVRGLLRDYNCDLTPPEGWKQDRSKQEETGALYALRHTDPTTFAALHVEDYKERFPSKAILVEVFKDRLGRLFKDLAWQPRAPGTIDHFDRAGTLGKQPAYVLEFEGRYDDVDYEGECYIMEYRGYVYWLAFFGPPSSGEQKEAVRKAWDELRERFLVLDRREGWQPQPRKQKTHPGKGYELNYPADVWHKPDNVQNPDPAADLLLHGLDPRAEKEGEDSRAGKTAFLNVVLLPADDKETGKALRDHFLARHVDIGTGKLDDLQLKALEDRKGKPMEGPIDVGKQKGHLLKARLTVTGGTADRFVVLLSVPRGKDTLGLYLDAPFKYREYWELEASALLEGLRPK